MTPDDDRRRHGSSRRRFLATAATTSLAGIAGCSSLPGGSGGGNRESEPLSIADFRGSGPLVENRPAPGGTSMDDLPDLEGKLNIYIGGGEGGLYGDLLDLLKRKYPKFRPSPKSDASASLANTIVEEQKAGGSRADVFWSVDAGSLAYVAGKGGAATLPSKITSMAADNFAGPQDRWVGVAGRARSVPYNTNQLSASDIPDKVRGFPETSALGNAMGWAPTYGAFQSFVTAMRLLQGKQATKDWLTAMMDSGVSRYPDEFFVSNAVADGEVAAGFANHYYALRVKSQRPNAPIDLAFTTEDAGALINVSGVQLIKGTKRSDLARAFVRHLLSAEAQEFFATTTFAYPTVPGVTPVGGLPSIDELKPPDVSLAKLSNLQPTLDLMRDVGVL